jgi:hypothetical protein
MELCFSYTPGLSNGPANPLNKNADSFLKFLSWLVKNGVEVPHFSIDDHYLNSYGAVARPWNGFKIILNALQSDEDFSIGTVEFLVNNVSLSPWYGSADQPAYPFIAKSYAKKTTILSAHAIITMF